MPAPAMTRGVAVRPVVAAVVAVAVARGADAALRAAAEFADGDDQRLVRAGRARRGRRSGPTGRRRASGPTGSSSARSGRRGSSHEWLSLVGDLRPDRLRRRACRLRPAGGRAGSSGRTCCGRSGRGSRRLLLVRSNASRARPRDDQAQGLVVVLVEVVLGDGLVDLRHARR